MNIYQEISSCVRKFMNEIFRPPVNKHLTWFDFYRRQNKYTKLVLMLIYNLQNHLSPTLMSVSPRNQLTDFCLMTVFGDLALKSQHRIYTDSRCMRIMRGSRQFKNSQISQYMKIIDSGKNMLKVTKENLTKKLVTEQWTTI